jgi:hypothetical protein
MIEQRGQMKNDFDDWFDEQCEINGPFWHLSPDMRKEYERVPFRPAKKERIEIETNPVSISIPHTEVRNGKLTYVMTNGYTEDNWTIPKWVKRGKIEVVHE